MNLPDASGSKGVLVQTFEMVHEPRRGRTVGVDFANLPLEWLLLCCTTAGALCSGRGSIRSGPKGKDLAKLDRQQAHGLYGVNIDWFFFPSVAGRSEGKVKSFMAVHPLVQSTNSMAFGS